MDKYINYIIIGGFLLILIFNGYNTCNLQKLIDRQPAVKETVYIQGKDSIVYVPKTVYIREKQIPSETKDSITYTSNSTFKQIQDKDTFTVKADQSFNIDTKEFSLGLEIFYKAKEHFRVDTLFKYVDRTITESPPMLMNTFFWTTVALYAVVIVQLIFNQ